MKKLLLIVFAFIATIAEAQAPKGTFSVKPMAGVNISTFGSPAIEDIYHSKVRFTVGAEVEYGINEWLGMSLGMMYSQQGAKIDGSLNLLQQLETGDYLYSLSKMDGYLHADYLNFPLTARVYIPALRGLSINSGIQVGVLVNDRMTMDLESVSKRGSGNLSPDTWTMTPNDYVATYTQVSMNDVCKSVDFGIPLGLSYEYKNVSLDIHYYFGLTRFDKTEDPDTAKNRYLSITLGYRFHL